MVEQEVTPKEILSVKFYKESNGNEPAKKWLKSLDKEDRIIIGQDIDTVQKGWPLGMPLVRSLKNSLWEVRSNLKDGIARVIFSMKNGQLIILHGFIKKTQKAPAKEIDIALSRLKNLK